MNKSLNRVNSIGSVYSPAEAQAVIEQWTEIAKSLFDQDLRSIQKNLTKKINNKEQIPDEFLNSNHIAYQVASVVTKELIVRRNRMHEEQLADLRAKHHERLKAVYGK